MKRSIVDDSDTEQSVGKIKHKKPNDSDVQYFEQKLKEANEGLPSSQYLVGHCYTLGFGTEQNSTLAIEWFQKAAGQSHVESCFGLGLVFKDRKDEMYNKAVSLLPSCLNQASNHLLFYIGMLYLNGFTGYEKSIEKAVEYFTKSSNQMWWTIHNRVEYYGSIQSMNTIGKLLLKDYGQVMECLSKVDGSNAMFIMGYVYCIGQVVEKDYHKAMEWFLKSSELGNTDAKYYIGMMYYNGEGVEQDYRKAMEWFLKASKLGDTHAMINIGTMHYNGEGVEKDYNKALEWFLKASELGNCNSMFNIGIMYSNGEGVEQDYIKAMEWFLKSAELGNNDAMCYVGTMYNNYGLGIEQDYNKAMEWYLKASKLGNTDAMFNIGLMYHNGEGVKKDLSKAIEWYSKAGNAESMKSLSAVYLEQNNYLDSSMWLDRYDNRGVQDYIVIENPVENFGRNIIRVDDDVCCGDSIECKIFIVRLIEGDMKVNGQVLNNIPFFQTMMNEHWMQSHEEEDGVTVLDLKSIQSDDETPLEMNLLDIYFKMKQDESTNQLDTPTWIQLFNLAKYFTDTHFMKSIIEKVGLIERWYLLRYMNRFTSTDYMVLQLYLLENIEIIQKLPMEIIQSLIHDDRIHRDTRLRLIMAIQSQRTLEFDLEDTRILLAQPKTSIGIIPKQNRTDISTKSTVLLNCTLEVLFQNTSVIITITNTDESTTNLIEVYLQTHFKCLSNSTIAKPQGHLLRVDTKPIVLTLHSPFEKSENFEFEFSGLVFKTSTQN